MYIVKIYLSMVKRISVRKRKVSKTRRRSSKRRVSKTRRRSSKRRVSKTRRRSSKRRVSRRKQQRGGAQAKLAKAAAKAAAKAKIIDQRREWTNNLKMQLNRADPKRHSRDTIKTAIKKAKKLVSDIKGLYTKYEFMKEEDDTTRHWPNYGDPDHSSTVYRLWGDSNARDALLAAAYDAEGMSDVKPSRFGEPRGQVLWQILA